MTISQYARETYARQIERRGKGWKNVADDIRAGGTPTIWVEPALIAIDEARRFGPQEADEAGQT